MSVPYESFLEGFKWEILCCAAFEDAQAFWEPMATLRGYLSDPADDDIKRAELAERALRELFEKGLIFFHVWDFKQDFWAAHDAAKQNPDLRLSDAEVEAQLVADWWRGSEPPDDGGPSIWWDVLEAGEQRAEEHDWQAHKTWLNSVRS